MNSQQEINVGVDTGKTQLDIFIRPVGDYFTVTNNASGIKEAITRIKTYNLDYPAFTRHWLIPKNTPLHI